MGPFASISEAWAALLRQAWLILIVFAVGLPSAYFYAKSQPRYYEATGVLAVQGSQNPVMPTGSPLPNMRISDRIDEIQRILLSRENVAALIDTYGLFPGVESETVKFYLSQGAISFNRLYAQSDFGQAGAQPYGLSISVRLEDPEKATVLANDLLQATVIEDSRLARARMANNFEQMNDLLGYLRAEESRVGVEIDGVEAEIAEFRKTNVASLPDNLPVLREKLGELQSLRVSVEREIADLGRTQGQLTSAAAERFRAQIEGRLSTVLGELAVTEAALESAPEVERQLGALTRRLATLEAELAAIAMQRAQVSMSQTFASGTDVAHLTVLEEALIPEFPISGSRRKLALAGGGAVALLAFLLALGRELLHPVIRTAAQMQRQLDIAPVVVIPYVAPPTNHFRRATTAGLVAILLILVWVVSTQSEGMSPRTIFNLLERDVPAWLGGEAEDSQ